MTTIGLSYSLVKRSTKCAPALITEGLPREIELRQKQYEYYRDLLLSFPKPEAPTVAQA